ncbi:MAG: HDIG domain-containing protein [Acidobacteria bacterium]|nr:HDIG domain-containing protein [Acidobacteriota bacterium]
MANLARLDKGWDRQPQKYILRLLKSLRSKLTWRDFIVGFCATVAITAILVGFRHQNIPEFEEGQTANQDIRASKDAQYIDFEATAIKRAEAENGIPFVYQLDQDRISDIKSAVSRVFSDARMLLEEKEVSRQRQSNSQLQQDLLNELKSLVGDFFPSDLLKILVRENFDPTVEKKILEILDAVLKEGIIEDREGFAQHQKIGIVIRDNSPFEHLLADAGPVRDLSEAKKDLRRFDLDIPRWTSKEKDQLIRYLETMLVPTLVYNKEETEARRALAVSRIPPVEVQIKRGQTIVRYGETITADLLRQLNALRDLWKPSSIILQGLGYFLFVVILVYSLWRYFVFFQSRHKKIRNYATLALVIITSELLIIRLATALADILDERFSRFQDPSVLYYAIPFALGPLLATILIDVNLGIITSIILATLTGLFYGEIDSAVYLITGSLAGIYSIRKYKDRAAILEAGFAIGFLNCICLLGMHILRQNPVSLSNGIDLIIVAFLSGILASTMASMMLPALELIFRVVTDIRLLELSNLNAPILRRLSVEAPGTYHHSLMVATLAEDAAEAIGANPLLARVSSYYHDIGKVIKPEYFVENQSRDYNKHEEISPRISCLVLNRHVKDGLKLAKEIGLPERIREMIPQHHGTRMMTYFFKKARQTADNRNGEVLDADFRYAGPKPQTKEAAIMMMADSVEAASRTLLDPNSSQIKGMIDRLVNGILEEDQFDECDITLSDIRLVKESFFKILTGVFHRRIDYPDYDFKRIDPEAEGTAVPNTGSEQAKTV